MFYLVVRGQPLREGGFHDFKLAESEAWILMKKENKQVDIVEAIATFTPKREAS